MPTEDNPVRAVDVFIDELDIEALGISGVVPEVTGRPAYHSATLLKIYLYGYLTHRIAAVRSECRSCSRATAIAPMRDRHFPHGQLNRVLDLRNIALGATDCGRTICCHISSLR